MKGGDKMVLTSLIAEAKTLPGFSEYHGVLLDILIGTVILAVVLAIIATVTRSKALLWWTFLAVVIGFSLMTLVSLMQLIIGQTINIKIEGIVLALLTGAGAIYGFHSLRHWNAPSEDTDDDEDDD
jgi:hypothetical protein